RRTTVADEYEALLAAGPLRKLLLDKAPLVHQVNRYRRERIRFRINGETPLERTMLEDNPVFWAIGDAIDPDAFSAPGISASMDAKLDQFLARTVMFARGERPFDLIPSSANEYGRAGGDHASSRTQSRHRRGGRRKEAASPDMTPEQLL